MLMKEIPAPEIALIEIAEVTNVLASEQEAVIRFTSTCGEQIALAAPLAVLKDAMAQIHIGKP